MRFASYAARPDYPRLSPGESIRISGLSAPVDVAQRPDGFWRITAPNETDAMRVQGYLVARDRMFQLDLFRHLARGEAAALLGLRSFGGGTTLTADIANRALGFHRNALYAISRTSPQEVAMLQAYVDGINAWIAENHLSIEHRLLGATTVRPWEASDSIAIYFMLMHSLSSNADREVRRLAIACEAGIDAMEQVFPTAVEFGSYALPEEAFSLTRYKVPAAVVPEMRAELPRLCPPGLVASAAPRQDFPPEPLAMLGALGTFSSSNNWVVTGPISKSGFPLLSSDPHLPHTNPPILWGFEMKTPGNHVAGFTIPGLHRVVFGHNFYVAWGATTNHVDRQDLVVHKGWSSIAGGPIDGYELDGKYTAFETRTEHFEIRGAEARDVKIRFTKDGPLLNDIDPQAADRIPLTALRMASTGEARDLDGAAKINHARSAADFIAAIDLYDQGCSNWVFGDKAGGFGYRSPCRLPIRKGWQGAFPVPGWLSKYQWSGYVPKSKLPKSTNPDRGWLVTANSQIIPADRFFTTYNNDAQAPNRMRRIAERIASDAVTGMTRESSEAIQADVTDQRWPIVRNELANGFCGPTVPGIAAEDAAWRQRLCAWSGSFDANSPEATIYTLWMNAILDHALADALPSGATGDTWRYVQSLPQFEAVVQWLWTRHANDRIWDDLRTSGVERRDEILTAAFRSAMAYGRQKYGTDPARWRWGYVRPFILRHPFAAQDGLVGEVFNTPGLAIGGDVESVFKQHFVRSDREHMSPVVGPVIRFTIDMAEPWAASYALAGGESGWPGSPHYSDLLGDWAAGRTRPLTPPASAADINVKFVP